jgi:sugar O-acyltransferase (sialic acid O-acetyltransferase NeuD family)
MSQQKIILVGGGGHCKAVIDVIESNGSYEILGILDVQEKVGETVLGYPIIGTDEQIGKYISSDVCFLVSIGQIKTARVRRTLFEELKRQGAQLATIISPTAYVSRHSIVGEGCIIMHHATVNAGVIIGSNTILNTSCNVDHDVKIGDHCHVSTHAVINGGCEIGSGTFIGSNSVFNQGVHIAENVIIGAGTVVNKAILEPGIYAGVPFKRIEQ